jgi:hypothetical protein
VGISADTIAAGAGCATVNGNPCQGAVYVFHKPKAGWHSETETAKLTVSNAEFAEHLGYSVGISGDTVVASTSVATVNGNPGQGAAYVFVKPQGGWHSETETAKLTASDGAERDFFGYSAAVSGDTVVVGAGATVNGNPEEGAAYVFVKPKGGWLSETETAKLTASDGAAFDLLGGSVGISGDTIVAGAPFAIVNGNPGQGAAYVFVKPKGGWLSETKTAKLTASDGAAEDVIAAVGVSRDTIVADAPGATVNGNFAQGAVYVFGDGASDPQSVADASFTAHGSDAATALHRRRNQLRRPQCRACAAEPRIITPNLSGPPFDRRQGPLSR